MNLNDSSAAKVGANIVSFIASATAAFRQFTIYSATTFSTVISGAFGIVKNGPGTLTLTATNTYTGGTIVNAGTLQIGNGTNITASVGTVTLSGGNLAYNYSAFVNSNGAITLARDATITKLGTLQQNLQVGTLNGGGKTLNVNVAGTTALYFNQTFGTALGLVNILTGAVGVDGARGIPLRDAVITVATGAQFRTYTSPTINNAITLNGGAGPNATGALWNESVVAAHTPIYTGTITLATGTNSSVGNSTSGFTITGKITGAGSFTKVGTGILSTFSTLTVANDYTGSTTISAGTLRVLKPFAATTPTASFTATTLSVSFSVAPTAGMTFRFFQGTTTNTYASVTLVGAPGRTGTYNSANSTLTIA